MQVLYGLLHHCSFSLELLQLLLMSGVVPQYRLELLIQILILQDHSLALDLGVFCQKFQYLSCLSLLYLSSLYREYKMLVAEEVRRILEFFLYLCEQLVEIPRLRKSQNDT